MKKQSTSDLARILLEDGTIKAKKFERGHLTFIIVEAFKQLYKIDNPYSKHPKITQLKEKVKLSGFSFN